MQIPARIQRWIEIDLDALAANCLEVRRHLAENVRLMAVVKANGYGMGSVACARVFEQYAEMLAVTTIEEGIELRLADIKGISAEKAMKIHESYVDKMGAANLVMFLQEFGISIKMAAKIHPLKIADAQK